MCVCRPKLRPSSSTRRDDHSDRKVRSEKQAELRGRAEGKDRSPGGRYVARNEVVEDSERPRERLGQESGKQALLRELQEDGEFENNLRSAKIRANTDERAKIAPSRVLENSDESGTPRDIVVKKQLQMLRLRVQTLEKEKEAQAKKYQQLENELEQRNAELARMKDELSKALQNNYPRSPSNPVSSSLPSHLPMSRLSSKPTCQVPECENTKLSQHGFCSKHRFGMATPARSPSKSTRTPKAGDDESAHDSFEELEAMFNDTRGSFQFGSTPMKIPTPRSVQGTPLSARRTPRVHETPRSSELVAIAKDGYGSANEDGNLLDESYPESELSDDAHTKPLVPVSKLNLNKLHEDGQHIKALRILDVPDKNFDLNASFEITRDGTFKRGGFQINQFGLLPANKAEAHSRLRSNEFKVRLSFFKPYPAISATFVYHDQSDAGVTRPRIQRSRLQSFPHTVPFHGIPPPFGAGNLTLKFVCVCFPYIIADARHLL